MNDREFEKIAASSRRAVILSALGAVIVIGSLAYSAYKLIDMEKAVAKKQRQIAVLDVEVKEREARIASLTNTLEGLRNTQDDLLDFLAKVTDESQVSILDPAVDWNAVKSDIEKLPPGRRKQAILTAILLAWKEIPFTMGKQSVGKGFDSPRFIEYVLSRNGVRINKKPDERMSDALMRTFKKVEKPRPGDLVFYRGQVGSFGFIYLSDGGPSGSGVGIGTLQAIAPLQIISLNNINTPYFPQIGYFRVVYPDETQQAQQSAPADARSRSRR